MVLKKCIVCGDNFNNHGNQKICSKEECKKELIQQRNNKRRKYPLDKKGFRTCSKCKSVFPETSSFFRKQKRGKNGFHAVCKKCLKQKNKNNQQSRVRKIIRRISSYFIVDLIKTELGCVVCNQPKLSLEIDFHHIGKKDYEMSYLMHHGLVDLLLDEIQKCIPVCCKCHRMIHYKKRNNYNVFI